MGLTAPRTADPPRNIPPPERWRELSPLLDELLDLAGPARQARLESLEPEKDPIPQTIRLVPQRSSTGTSESTHRGISQKAQRRPLVTPP